MGINNLNPLIDQNCHHLFRPIPLSEFKGHYVAIDLSIMMHQCHIYHFRRAIEGVNILSQQDIDALGDKVMKKTISELLKRIRRDFVRHGIKPIIVVDGESPQLKKLNAGLRRRTLRENAKKRLKSLLAKLKRDKVTRENISPALYKEVTNLHCRTQEISRAMHEPIIEAIRKKGYAILQATNEAEELCTKLCLDGRVKAVYSTDTDNIARKCPLLITDIIWEKTDDDFEFYANTVSYHPEIHEILGLGYAQFLDFCIMNGCDYNKRVKGMREENIILNLFFYGSIDKLEKAENLDFACLNYQECRQLFAERPLEVCCANYEDIKLYVPIGDQSD